MTACTGRLVVFSSTLQSIKLTGALSYAVLWSVLIMKMMY